MLATEYDTARQLTSVLRFHAAQKLVENYFPILPALSVVVVGVASAQPPALSFYKDIKPWKGCTKPFTPSFYSVSFPLSLSVFLSALPAWLVVELGAAGQHPITRIPKQPGLGSRNTCRILRIIRIRCPHFHASAQWAAKVFFFVQKDVRERERETGEFKL